MRNSTSYSKLTSGNGQILYLGEPLGAGLLSSVANVIEAFPGEEEYLFDQVEINLIIISAQYRRSIHSRWGTDSNNISEALRKLLDAARQREIEVAYWITSTGVTEFDRLMASACGIVFCAYDAQLTEFEGESIQCLSLPISPLSPRLDKRTSADSSSKIIDLYQGFSELPSRVSAGKDRTKDFDGQPVRYTTVDGYWRTQSKQSMVGANKWIQRAKGVQNEPGNIFVAGIDGAGEPPMFEFLDGILSGKIPMIYSAKSSGTRRYIFPKIFRSTRMPVLSQGGVESWGEARKAHYWRAWSEVICFGLFEVAWSKLLLALDYRHGLEVLQPKTILLGNSNGDAFVTGPPNEISKLLLEGYEVLLRGNDGNVTRYWHQNGHMLSANINWNEYAEAQVNPAIEVDGDCINELALRTAATMSSLDESLTNFEVPVIDNKDNLNWVEVKPLRRVEG